MRQRQATFSLAASTLTGCWFTLVSANLFAQDWHQWRGPNRDGVLQTPIQLSEAGPIENWTSAISSGYSGPTVSNGRVFVMDRKVDPKQTERVICLDEATGQVVWLHEYDSVYRGIGYPAGPRASVSVHNGKAYSIGSMGAAFCFNAKDGAIIWKADFNERHSIVASKRMPIWGISASPLIVGKVAVFHIGGDQGACIVAVDTNTGKEAWRALEDRAQYSAPMLMEHAGVTSIICWTGDSVASLNPENGDVNWRFEFKPRNMPIGVATPVINGNRIFVTSFYDGSLMLEVNEDNSSVTEVWSAVGANERRTKSLQSIISTPIWLGEHIYGVDSYGQLRCLDANTGIRVWENLDAVPKARWSTIHFVKNGLNGDTVWMFNERGEIIVANLTPDGYKELSRHPIIQPTRGQLPQRGGVCWSHPVFANGNIIVRNDKEIKSWNLRGKEDK